MPPAGSDTATPEKIPESKQASVASSAINSLSTNPATSTSGAVPGEGGVTQESGLGKVEEKGKTQEELDAEKRYEEAIEEEYAKREGGA
jgi:hypothetical protein